SFAEVVMNVETGHHRGDPLARLVHAEELGNDIAQGVGAVICAEQRDLRHLPLREEPIRDSTLIENLDGACVQTDRARRGAPIILTVDAAAMHAAGHAFYQAANGVRPPTTCRPATCRAGPARAGSRRTRPFHARGSAVHPGSAGWHAPPPRRPASRTPGRSPRHGSPGPPPPSPGRWSRRSGASSWGPCRRGPV